MGVGLLKPGVLIDRDGVINPMWADAEHGTIDSPAHPDQFSLLAGVGLAIRALNEAGVPVAVVSNQPGVAKGKLVPRLLEAITRKLTEELAGKGARLDGIYYCIHHPDAVVPEYRVRCDCRKPEPGLLLTAARSLHLDLSRSFMIGDGVTDILAGHRAGCRTIWIGQMKCDMCHLMRTEDATPDHVAPDLAAAVDVILRMWRPSTASLFTSDGSPSL